MRDTWTVHTAALDGTLFTAEVPVNRNPDAVLAAHAGLPHPPVWFTPADVATFINAMVRRQAEALDAFDAMPAEVEDAVIRFAYRHCLIRQEGQRVTLTRYGRRYLRNYGGTR